MPSIIKRKEPKANGALVFRLMKPIGAGWLSKGCIGTFAVPETDKIFRGH
jgi:hypothetical protein